MNRERWVGLRSRVEKDICMDNRAKISSMTPGGPTYLTFWARNKAFT